ncbi:hypothetical protein MJO29_004265 [Puccinia striiformis f. sp. tritici]|nr:hypothetical protein MJO29_004265 [Puccinia striiformis f. sp. tritici]
MANLAPVIYPAINQNARAQTANNSMERINSTILKTALEAIPLLTPDNYSLWKNCIGNMLDLQGLRDSPTAQDGSLTDMEDAQLRTIIISKLDSSIHPNIINHENKTKAQDIWTSITSYFASTQPSNHAGSSTIMTINSCLFEISINLPKDMIAYSLLKKLPPLLSNISQQITHSEKAITSDLILNHLRLYNNDQLVIANQVSSSRTNVVSLFTDASKKCKKNADNVQSKHPEAKCWMLYPHLHQNSGRSEASVSSFHTSLSQSSPFFILDSGSSAHMVSNIDLFYAINQTEIGIVWTSSGKDSLKIEGKGSIRLINKHGSINLHNVLLVPGLIVNLLSIRRLVLENYLVNFSKNSFFITQYGQMKMNGRYISNLPSLTFINAEHCSHLSSSEILHKSLGHVSHHRIRQNLGIPLKITSNCKACALAKITKASFKNKHDPAARPFEELNLDLIGPISPQSREGHKYILTVVDSNTRYCSAIPIKTKAEVAGTLSFVIDMEAKRFSYYPSVLHLDRGTEFINSSLQDFCKSHLIRSRTSDPYTPQQNGLAERFNRTILKAMRTILKDSGISLHFWCDIVKVSALTLNQIPAHKSKKSPFELFKNRSLPLDFFHPIRNCVSYLILLHKSFSNLMPKGELGTLIGYNDEIQSWKILNEQGKIIDTKHVWFLDYTTPLTITEDKEDFLIIEESEAPQDHFNPQFTDPEDPQEAIKDEETEIPVVVIKNEDKDTHEIDSDSSSSNDSDIDVLESLVPTVALTRVLRDRTSKVKPVKYSCLSTDNPTSFKKAMNSLEGSKWKEATDEELGNIEAHEVWDDVWSKPDSYLHTLWIFKTQPSTLSSAERKKARLCIQGFLQLPDKYENTFAPTGKFTTLLVLLMFAEDIYIKTPEGLNHNAPFLKLKNSLYGLKQAPANWYKTLTGWFVDINFHQSTSDPLGNVDVFEGLFMNRFPNSSAHSPDTLLGMDIQQSSNSISLSQPKLVQKGLDLLGLLQGIAHQIESIRVFEFEFDLIRILPGQFFYLRVLKNPSNTTVLCLGSLLDCCSVKTPLSVGVQLVEASKEDKLEFEKLKINYQSFTGILNFLACRTRPDLAPAVSILSAFNHAPGIKHWKEVLHCWKYLSGSINLNLTLTPDSSDTSQALKYYTDATCAEDLKTRLSRSGTICFWKSCPISWNGKKPKNITLSSTGAELNALSNGAQENQWITYLVEELWKEKLNPSEFHVDNQGLIEKIKKFGSHSKTKHLDIKVKWLRDLKKNNQINVKLIPSEEMVADALTKACNSTSLSKLTERCFLVLFCKVWK